MTPPQNRTPVQRDRQLSRSSLRDGVYDAVLEMLLSDEFTPGQSLGIDAVARMLGVSPSPVREALAELEHTGLITRAALRGYTVAQPLSREQMAELLAARAVLETAAVAGVFPVDAALVGLLRKAHTEHMAAGRQVLDSVTGDDGSRNLSTVRAYYDADQAFHLILLENCGNRYLLSMSKSLSPHLHRLRQQISSGDNDVEEATHEHGRILAAVERGDSAAAQEAMRDHLDAVRRRALAEAEVAAPSSSPPAKTPPTPKPRSRQRT
ncbi:GntR family transcriptional regulator [Streptomyces shenzhenensis]